MRQVVEGPKITKIAKKNVKSLILTDSLGITAFIVSHDYKLHSIIVWRCIIIYKTKINPVLFLSIYQIIGKTLILTLYIYRVSRTTLYTGGVRGVLPPSPCDLSSQLCDFQNVSVYLFVEMHIQNSIEIGQKIRLLLLFKENRHVFERFL